MNTFVHQIWQSTLTIALGEELAKDMGDSWESKTITSSGWTKDIDAFKTYLNNFAQQLALTSDGIKDGKRFEKLRTGEAKLFDKNDGLVQELYNELKCIADKPDDL